MKLASYHGTRAGLMGLGNMLIRLRLRGPYSHSEIVFEPGDGVDHLMPDGTCEPDASGALWCVSSTGLERIPPWSKRRPGKRGGVRFKRIALGEKWALDPVSNPEQAARWAVENEGRLYDWQLILGFLAWAVPTVLRIKSCYHSNRTFKVGVRKLNNRAIHEHITCVRA